MVFPLFGLAFFAAIDYAATPATNPVQTTLLGPESATLASIGWINDAVWFGHDDFAQIKDEAKGGTVQYQEGKERRVIRGEIYTPCRTMRST